MTRDAGTTKAFIEQLGREVRRRRLDAGMTMVQLAEASGVSRRMLGQIELGDANPSLVTVSKLATALGVDFPTLTRAEPGPPAELATLVRADEIGAIWASPAGSQGALAIASTARPPAELWLWTLEPGDSYDAEPDPPGSEELFLVLSGTLTLTTENADLRLEAGDAARIATDCRYSYRNEDTGSTRFVRVAHTSG